MGLILGEGEEKLPAPELRGTARVLGQGDGRRVKVSLDVGSSLPRSGRPSRGAGLPPPSASAILSSHGRAVFVCEVLSQVPGVRPWCSGQEESRGAHAPQLGAETPRFQLAVGFEPQD